MGNTNKKQNQDTDRVSKPKRRRTRRVGRGAVHDDPSASDSHEKNDSSSPVTLESSVSNGVSRKFYPSFLATTAALDRTPAVVSNVTVEQANTIAVQESKPVQSINEQGKRWYDHNYKAK